MTQFWLQDITEILSIHNFTFKGASTHDNYTKLLNILSLLTILTGGFMIIKTKKVASTFNLIIPQAKRHQLQGSNKKLRHCHLAHQ